MTSSGSLTIWRVIVIGFSGIFTIAIAVSFCLWLVIKCRMCCTFCNRKQHLRSNLRGIHLQFYNTLKPQSSPDEVCTNEDHQSNKNDARRHENHSCSQPKVKPKMKINSFSYNGTSRNMVVGKFRDVEAPRLKTTPSHREMNETSKSQPPDFKYSQGGLQHFIMKIENEVCIN